MDTWSSVSLLVPGMIHRNVDTDEMNSLELPVSFPPQSMWYKTVCILWDTLPRSLILVNLFTNPDEDVNELQR